MWSHHHHRLVEHAHAQFQFWYGVIRPDDKLQTVGGNADVQQIPEVIML